MLEAAKCPECGALYIPPRTFCPKCRVKLEKTLTKGVGKVLSFTTIYVPPEGFPPPVYVAIVKLNDGVNLLCNTTKSCMHFNKHVVVYKRGDTYFAEPHNIFTILKKKVIQWLRQRGKKSEQKDQSTPS